MDQLGFANLLEYETRLEAARTARREPEVRIRRKPRRRWFRLGRAARPE
jgi:hypothetical protein